MDALNKIDTQRKMGTEPFHVNGQALPFRVLDFWQWSSSDLVGNVMRGVLAEYLIACELGVTSGIRVEWDAYDLKTKQGVRIEVKSAAYLQSWYQARLSAISFDIRPTTGWDASTNIYGTVRKRQADVYIFAVLEHKDKATIDPLNVNQWTFYILPTAILDAELPNQKRLSLGGLERLRPLQAKFGEIADAIASVFPTPLARQET